MEGVDNPSLLKVMLLSWYVTCPMGVSLNTKTYLVIYCYNKIVSIMLLKDD